MLPPPINFRSVAKPLTIEFARSTEAVSGPAPSMSVAVTPLPEAPGPTTVTWRALIVAE